MPKNPKLNNRAFSLLSALVALVIMGIIFYMVQSLLTMGFRGGAHTDLTYAIHALQNSIEQKVDCTKTFKNINVNSDCNPVTLKAILLKDANDQPITDPLKPVIGLYRPGDGTLEGAGKMGAWYLRAYCETSGNLVIRFARVSNPTAASITFVADPLLKRPYDWSDSARNPLFGPPDRILCAGAPAPAPPPMQCRIAIAIQPLPALCLPGEIATGGSCYCGTEAGSLNTGGQMLPNGYQCYNTPHGGGMACTLANWTYSYPGIAEARCCKFN